MKINFIRLEIQNFISYEKGVFDFKNGMDLLTGFNGKGKSTIPSAVFFALFGKSDKKLKKESLVNNIKGKETLVALYLKANDRELKIIRGIKPNKFEIYEYKDDEYKIIEEKANLKDYQEMLENILKIDETVYKQLVSISANMPNSKPFMELNKKEKELLFQVITDTSIFNDIKEITKNRKSELKTKIDSLMYKEQVLKDSIVSEEKSIEAAENRNIEFNKHRDKNIKSSETKITEMNQKITKYKEGLEKLKKLKEEYTQKSKTLEGLKEKISQNKSNKSELEQELKYIERAEKDAVTCEECGHKNYLVHIDFSKKEVHQENIQSYKEQIELLEGEYNELEGVVHELKEKLLQGRRVKDNLMHLEESLIQTKDYLNELHEWKALDIDYSNLNSNKEQLENLRANLKITKDEYNKIQKLDKIISDGNLKEMVISEQIPLLNKEINYFLELFSLLDYNFIIDEKFQERIITREKESEFQALSNGQKSRVSFAIMFAFLKLIENRNGVKMNLLFLDEVLDSSVDAEGRDDLLGILKREFSSSKDIIIVSHSDEIKEKAEIFDRFIHIIKDKFSKIIVS